jgi:glutamate synthase domain-containing protein 3
VVANRLLGDWANALGQFVKVMPRAYKKALLELARERPSGSSPNVERAVRPAPSLQSA